MRTTMSEIIDLELTQAIERYMEMEPKFVFDAIKREWPEQLAALLVEFMFDIICGDGDGMADYVHIVREDGHNCYIVPIGSCELCDE